MSQKLDYEKGSSSGNCGEKLVTIQFPAVLWFQTKSLSGMSLFQNLLQFQLYTAILSFGYIGLYHESVIW